MSDSTRKTLTADYETQSFLIPAYRLAGIQGRLEGLSRQAEKLGMPAFTVEVGDLVYKSDPKTQVQHQYYPLSVTGGVPKIDGWRFAAKIEHNKNPDPDAEAAYINIVSGFRVDSLIDKDPSLMGGLAHCDPDCDHCQTRRNRNTTFLFENDADGELIQVGSTCVTDFSGHDDPLLLAAASQWPTVIDELRTADSEEFDMGIGATFSGFEPARVLAAGVAVVRLEGQWKPREQCHHGLGTPGEVEYLLAKPADYDRVVKPDDVVAANAIIDWLRSDDFDPDGSMYLNNLSVMARTGHVPNNKAGLMASGVAAWAKHQRQTRGLDDKGVPIASVKLGQPGDKLEVQAVVEKLIPIETFYGTSVLHLLRDTETQARLTWFNSGRVTLYEGDTYTLKGTVKDHSVRDGVMQTQLTRVNAVDQKPLRYLDFGHPPQDFTAEKFIKQFPKKVPDISIRDRQGSTALHYLCHHYWVDDADESMAKERKTAIEWLLERGADIGQVNLRGERPIDSVIYSRDEALVRACLERWPSCVDHLDSDRIHQHLVRDADCEAESRIGELVLELQKSRRAGGVFGVASTSGEVSTPGASRAAPSMDEDDEDIMSDPALRLA